MLKKVIYTTGNIVVDCEPKHVAGSNNVKYIINPNSNYKLSCVRLYMLQFIYQYYYLTTQRRCLTWK